MTEKRVINHNQKVGKWGENCAQKYLMDHGYEIIALNFRTPEGEIDIIAKNKEGIVFTEVKTRSNTSLEYPEEAITDTKLEHMLNCAEWYMIQHPELDDNWRIDVIAIIGRMVEQNPSIEWFQNVA